MNENSSVSQPVLFGPFVPFTILSLSLGVVLVWTLIVTARDLAASVRVRDQQTVASVQAADAEEKMKGMMMELLVMAETDADAKTIAEKYQIRFNSPVGTRPSASPTPGPANSRRAAPKASATESAVAPAPGGQEP